MATLAVAGSGVVLAVFDRNVKQSKLSNQIFRYGTNGEPPMVAITGRKALGKSAAALGLAVGLIATPALMQSAAAVSDSGEGAFTVKSSTTAAISLASPAWVSVTFLGGKCQVTEFSMTVTPPSGVTVSYPTEPRGGKDTSLYGDDTLDAGELDFASFNLTATSKASVGEQKMTADITYGVDTNCLGTSKEKGKITKVKASYTLVVPVTK
jgi:hypothetical protein